MSNQLTPVAQCVIAFLKRKKNPVTMREIVEHVDAKLPNNDHRKIWNAVWNGCNFPLNKPYFMRKEVKGKKRVQTVFSFNR